MWISKKQVVPENRSSYDALVGARSLDVTRLLAFVANTLARSLRRTVSGKMTNFTT